MHEAIVTHEEFQKVQEILKLGRKRGSHGIQEYPLKVLSDVQSAIG